MIIQCEKCTTKFRLDDSRVTDAGVRVRCSRCSHTFVVRRESPDGYGDFGVMLDGLLGADDAADEDRGAGGAGADDVSVAHEQSVDGGVLAHGDNGENHESLERPADETDDRLNVATSPDGPVPDSIGDAPCSAGNEVPGNTLADLLEDSAVAAEQVEPETRPEVESVLTSDLGNGWNIDHVEESNISMSEPELQPDDAAVCPESFVGELRAAEADDFVALDSESISASPAVPPRGDTAVEESGSLRHDLWPVADAGNEDEDDDELPPLSIASRRKSSPFAPAMLGIVLLVVLAGALFYLFSDKMAGLIPDSLVQSLGVDGKTVGGAAIRSLEGHFLVNRSAGELFVMRGEVVNVSGAPLTALRVRGTLYGAAGEVIAQRTVYCGNDLAPADLAFNSYTSIERTMGRMLGSDLANLELLPGKAMPFLIVFKGVPAQAKDFAATVVTPEAGASAP